MGKKWADFVSRSTITQIASKPALVLGNPDTKSIAILSHFHCGISKGCNIPEGLWCSIFTFWQVKHFETYSATSFFIPGHQNIAFKSWYILVLPGWMENPLLCASFKISCLKVPTSGTMILPLNLHNPSFSSDTLHCFPCSIAGNTFHNASSFWWAFRSSDLKSLEISNRLKHKVPDTSRAPIFRLSNPLSNFSSWSIIQAAYNDFRLNASATTFAFPGW